MAALPKWQQGIPTTVDMHYITGDWPTPKCRVCGSAEVTGYVVGKETHWACHNKSHHTLDAWRAVTPEPRITYPEQEEQMYSSDERSRLEAEIKHYRTMAESCQGALDKTLRMAEIQDALIVRQTAEIAELRDTVKRMAGLNWLGRSVDVTNMEQIP